jgi:ribosomal subunit interface protein
MEIEITWGEVEKSDALGAHVRERIDHALRNFGSHFMHVKAHLHDDNASKHGANDKRVVLEAKPSGHDMIVIEHSGDDLFKTINEGTKKLESAVRHFVDKHRKQH